MTRAVLLGILLSAKTTEDKEDEGQYEATTQRIRGNFQSHTVDIQSNAYFQTSTRISSGSEI